MSLEIKVHKIAKAFREMNDDEYKQLKESIDRDGFMLSMRYIKEDGVAMVVDGRNRLKYCKEKKLDPWKLTTANGAPLMEECHLDANQSLAGQITALNLSRRHLTKSERAAHAVNLLPFFEAEAKERQKTKAAAEPSANGKAEKKPPQKKGTARDAAAGAVGGVTGRVVGDAAKLKKQAPDLFDKVQAGEMPVGKAIATLNKRVAKAELDKAAADAPKPSNDDCRIITGDAIKELGKMKEGTFDLVFTDPPYNQDVKYGPGVDDKKTPEQYVAWCSKWIKECFRVLKSSGSMFIVISKPHIFHFHKSVKDAGFTVRNLLTWYETFGQNASNNFNNTSRIIFYLVKDAKKFTFNKEAILTTSKRQELGDKRANPEGKLWDDVIQIPRLVGNAKERIEGVPTQLPLDLVQPLVELASKPGGNVLDPFCGSGTTLMACSNSGRKCVTIEVDPATAEIANKRFLASLKHSG